MKLQFQHKWIASISIFIFSCLAFSALQAEIENITIKWTAMECQQSCIIGLEKQFRNINGVSDVIMNQSAGQAVLQWKPGVVLTFPPINTAMSMIGLSINEMHVKVRGTISHDARTVTINSLGDNTRFLLLSPVTPKSYVMVEEFNPQTHLLIPSTREQFIQAQDAAQIAIVEGPIFEPERSPPLKLVIARVKFIKAEEPPTGPTGSSHYQGSSSASLPTQPSLPVQPPWGTSDPFSGIPYHGVTGLPK